ncbi:MAG: endolytic transglycosylase MltG [Cytophagaceae bacterium]|nr:endolytic transglycosylase MltG [Cytophagaceae bacterium]
MFNTPNLNIERKQDFYLLIPTGATYQQVLDSLTKNNTVNDKTSFQFLSKLMKYPELVKVGRYRIRPDMANYAALKMLRSGDQVPLRLTFNNIRVKSDLVHKVGTRFEFDSLSFARMLDSDSVCRYYGFTPTTIMAMFLPDTYELFWNTTPQKLMGRMKSEYDKFWNPERRRQANLLNLSPIEVSVLASIVEAETKNQIEKPRVAGVYLNRLRKNMPLQADPTVIYALGDFGIRRVLKRQMFFDSPYNTYVHTGLPPGPINLPDPRSIDAVLKAESHNYLYFCASPELNGTHFFASNYEDHLSNARLYQQALDRLGIKK